MIKIVEIVDADSIANATLTLPFDSRQKARLHTQLDSGEEAGLFLPRGIILRHGNMLRAETGQIIKIISANENVSTVYSDDPLKLARACYHLGNRHVSLEINKNYIRYLHDHVLDEMVTNLGLVITNESQPFEPESGAYSNGSGHGHSHGH